MVKVYVLFKKDDRYKAKWDIEGIFSTHKEAQDNFIYRNGLFTIQEFELNKKQRFKLSPSLKN